MFQCKARGFPVILQLYRQFEFHFQFGKNQEECHGLQVSFFSVASNILPCLNIKNSPAKLQSTMELAWGQSVDPRVLYRENLR